MTRRKLATPILGIDQLSDETSLIRNEEANIQAVRLATNVDIDREGNVSRRKGATLQLSGSGYHSLYKAKRGWLVVCHDEDLGVYDPDVPSFTALTTMTESYLTSFTELNGNLYAVNPGYSGMFLVGSAVAKPIGVALPDLRPGFAAIATGNLDPGTYGITYSLVDPDGEESGLGPITTVELESGGGIQGLAFTIMSGYKYRVYMTTADGEELYQAVEFNADTVSVQIIEHEEGRQPRTMDLEPLPFGYTIRAYNSRLYVATNDFVYFSDVFRPHLYNPAHGFIPTTGFTSMVQPVDAGIFIGDRRGVRFYAGEDPTEFQEKEVSVEVPVFNTAVAVPGKFLPRELGLNNDKVAVWLSESGYQVGLPDGSLARLHAGQVELPAYVQGCSAVTTRDGRKQVVTPVNSNVVGAVNIAVDSVVDG
jgi:hypothetical protein